MFPRIDSACRIRWMACVLILISGCSAASPDPRPPTPRSQSERSEGKTPWFGGWRLGVDQGRAHIDDSVDSDQGFSSGLFLGRQLTSTQSVTKLGVEASLRLIGLDLEDSNAPFETSLGIRASDLFEPGESRLSLGLGLSYFTMTDFDDALGAYGRLELDKGWRILDFKALPFVSYSSSFDGGDRIRILTVGVSGHGPLD